MEEVRETVREGGWESVKKWRDMARVSEGSP